MTPMISKFSTLISLAVTLSPSFRTLKKIAKMPLNNSYACQQKMRHRATMLLHRTKMLLHRTNMQASSRTREIQGKCFIFITFPQYFMKSLFLPCAGFLLISLHFGLAFAHYSSKFSHKNHVMTNVITTPNLLC